ncbi:PKD domain-containing protein [Teredinibacter sp. KSP-S5-2]|uniref:PKD domain-containing protein n=1 Tax=Teredinibacter sp. KSP-S5-2 TaxID=3034506 RepID=UPI00293515FB|nr:hypothetical protein [Teredinibacter sp. KSP-S5-2]WNO08649.1 hypothetical protein P5V12_16890 [Teredinibacter sp. KSP-S5-2]
MRLFSKISLICTVTVALFACGGGGSSSNSGSTSSSSGGAIPNNPPQITLQHSQEVFEAEQVQITGTATDRDGVITDINWQQTAGPQIDTTSFNDISIIFQAPEVTDNTSIEFTVVATDNDGSTATETVSILIKAHPEIHFVFPTKRSAFESKNLEATGYLRHAPTGTTVAVSGGLGSVEATVNEAGFWRASNVVLPSESNKAANIVATATLPSGSQISTTVSIHTQPLSSSSSKLFWDSIRKQFSFYDFVQEKHYAISAETGEKKIMTASPEFAGGLWAYDAFNNRIISIGGEIKSYEIATQTTSTIITNYIGDTLNIQRPGSNYDDLQSTVIDDTGNFAFVSSRKASTNNNQIHKVNLTTGEWSLISSDEKGTGASLTSISNIVYDATNMKLYTLTGTSDVNLHLVVIDINTGDRTHLDNLSSPYWNDYSSAVTGGLHYNPIDEKAYWIDRNGILSVFNTFTGESKAVSVISPNYGLLDLGNMYSLSYFDKPSQSLFILGNNAASIHKINITTLETSVIENPNMPKLHPLNTLYYDELNDAIFHNTTQTFLNAQRITTLNRLDLREDTETTYRQSVDAMLGIWNTNIIYSLSFSRTHIGIQNIESRQYLPLIEESSNPDILTNQRLLSSCINEQNLYMVLNNGPLLVHADMETKEVNLIMDSVSLPGGPLTMEIIGCNKKNDQLAIVAQVNEEHELFFVDGKTGSVTSVLNLSRTIPESYRDSATYKLNTFKTTINDDFTNIYLSTYSNPSRKLDFIKINVTTKTAEILPKPGTGYLYQVDYFYSKLYIDENLNRLLMAGYENTLAVDIKTGQRAIVLH